MIKHIMFDLDGTLLALGLDDFIRTYIKALQQKFCELGYNGEQAVEGVWAGTYNMMHNDGTRTNREVFWHGFATKGFDDVEKIEQAVEGFYANEFGVVRTKLREERNLKELMDSLRAKGYTLTLATSPIFPLVAIKERLSWLGLSVEDFAWVTCYENCRYAKPNLGYYQDILKKNEFSPQESIMIGNDIFDDMPAGELGISTYLVTDVLENETEDYQSRYTHGTFAQLREYLNNLPKIKDE